MLKVLEHGWGLFPSRIQNLIGEGKNSITITIIHLINLDGIEIETRISKLTVCNTKA
jgi:hypothetical protein